MRRTRIATILTAIALAAGVSAATPAGAAVHHATPPVTAKPVPVPHIPDDWNWINPDNHPSHRQKHLPAVAPFRAASPATYPVYQYEYSSSFINVTGSETSASVTMTTAHQGFYGSDNTYGLQGTYKLGGNHTQGNLVIGGTCAKGNTACLNGGKPSVEILDMTGECKAPGTPCFTVSVWVDGKDQFTQGYTQNTSGGHPADGSYHPAIGGGITLGYTLSYQRLNITINGAIAGWIQTGVWGQTTFGPITEESPQSEVLNIDYGSFTAPYPSMNYTFSNFTDSVGNTVPAPTVSTPYTLSNISSTGWTVSGGKTPVTAGTYWQMPVGQDVGVCMGNYNDVNKDGNPVVIWACNGGSAQQWSYNKTTGEITNINGKCLDNPSPTGVNGTQLIIQTCDGTFAQSWNEWLQQGPNGMYIAYQNNNLNVCIDDPNDSTVNGTKLQIYTCNNSAAQNQDPFWVTNNG